jgi:hypothetical protein
MQSAVQDRILIAVAGTGQLSASAVLAECPYGADRRDFLRAVKVLIMDDAITGGPTYALTDKGRRRLTSAI